MSDQTPYTPTTEEVRESFASGVNFEMRTPFLSGPSLDARIEQGESDD